MWHTVCLEMVDDCLMWRMINTECLYYYITECLYYYVTIINERGRYQINIFVVNSGGGYKLGVYIANGGRSSLFIYFMEEDILSIDTLHMYNWYILEFNRYPVWADLPKPNPVSVPVWKESVSVLSNLQ